VLPPLRPERATAKRLAGRFTVITYDRRGRGESGDNQPYAPEREIEDLEALIDHAGGTTALYGSSSGAALALETARRHEDVEKLALYEAPFSEEPLRVSEHDKYATELAALLAADRRGNAARLFLATVGVPAPVIALMRLLPMWSKLKALAPTLAYDEAVLRLARSDLRLPAERWQTLTIPSLCLVGGDSPEWIHEGMRALVQALPTAEFRTLQGQPHAVKPTALAPVLEEFFARDGALANVLDCGAARRASITPSSPERTTKAA